MYAGFALTSLGFVVIAVSCFLRTRFLQPPAVLEKIFSCYLGLLFVLLGVAVSFLSGARRRGEGAERRGISTWIVVAACFLGSLVLFFRTFSIGFLADDFLIYWDVTYGCGTILDLFSPQKSFGHLRPVALFVWYAIGNTIGLYPSVFHVVCIGLHALNAAMIFLLLRRAFGLQATAILAAALFLIWPACSGVVAWISCLFDLVCACLVLVSLLAGLAFVQKGGWWRGVLSIACMVLASLAKETGFMSPLFLVALLLVVPGKGEEGRLQFRRKAVIGLSSVIVVAGFFMIRYVMLGGVGGYPVSPPSIERQVTVLDWIVREPRILFNAWLVPVNRSMYDGEVPVFPIAACVACAVIFGLGIAAGFRRRLWRTILLGFSFTVLGIFPALHLICPFDDLIGARYFYLPNLGASILFAVSVRQVFRAGVFGRVMTGVFILCWVLMLQINLWPWVKAGEHAKKITAEAKSLPEKISDGTDTCYFLFIPDHVYGAYVYCVGFRQMLKLHADFPRDLDIQVLKVGAEGFHIDRNFYPKEFTKNCPRLGSGVQVMVYDWSAKTISEVTPEAAEAYQGSDEVIIIKGENFMPAGPEVKQVEEGRFLSESGDLVVKLERDLPLKGLWKIEVDSSLADGSEYKDWEALVSLLRIKGRADAAPRHRVRFGRIPLAGSENSARLAEPVESFFQQGHAKALWLEVACRPQAWDLGEVRLFYRRLKK
jgi:hypothetical protein